jgi:hypothetical protein
VLAPALQLLDSASDVSSSLDMPVLDQDIQRLLDGLPGSQQQGGQGQQSAQQQPPMQPRGGAGSAAASGAASGSPAAARKQQRQQQEQRQSPGSAGSQSTEQLLRDLNTWMQDSSSGSSGARGRSSDQVQSGDSDRIQQLINR